jgi:2-dehydro-3-deoxyphosphogalactonate aldolase
VVRATDVQRTFDAGGRLIVAPNCDRDVIRRALDLGMTVMPGIATASEAFQAIDAGATILKLFPAVTYGAAHLKALKTVLPATIRMFPVGGIGAADLRAWLSAGADGFGFGSEIFRPEYGLAEIEQRARRLVESLTDAIRQAPSAAEQPGK